MLYIHWENITLDHFKLLDFGPHHRTLQQFFSQNYMVLGTHQIMSIIGMLQFFTESIDVADAELLCFLSGTIL